MKLIFLVALAGFLAFLPMSVSAAGEIGQLTTHLPVEVQKNKSFDFEVRLKPNSGDFNGTVNVKMQQNPNVEFAPGSFTLTPGQAQKVTAKVVKSDSGLAIIVAEAENWLPIDFAIHVGGVPVKLVANIEQPVESFWRKSLVVGFTDDAGKPVRLEAAAKLSLVGTNVLVCLNELTNCSRTVELPMKKEAESQTVELKATSWSADKGVITMTLSTPTGYIVSDGTFSVAIVPAWWILTIVGMLGGLAYSMIKFLMSFLKSRRKLSRAAWIRKASLAVLFGIVPGALAYPLAAWNLLGIKTDTTSLKGFFILGLLFAYVGMDVVLALTAPKKTRAT